MELRKGLLRSLLRSTIDGKFGVDIGDSVMRISLKAVDNHL
jgi:hypothetical protein